MQRFLMLAHRRKAAIRFEPLTRAASRARQGSLLLQPEAS